MTSSETRRNPSIWRVLFVGLAIVAVWLGGNQYSRFSTALRDYRRLNNLVGDLQIDDPSKATIMRLPRDAAFPRLDRWRVYLPDNSGYTNQPGLPASKSYSSRIFGISLLENGSYHVSSSSTLFTGESAFVINGYINTEQGIERISFVRGIKGSTSEASIVSNTDPISMDPQMREVYFSEPLNCVSSDIQQPICLKAIYGRLDAGTSNPVLLSALFICSGSGPVVDADALIPFALPLDKDVMEGASK